MYQIQQVTMPAGQELTQPMFIQSTSQTADSQVTTQVSADWDPSCPLVTTSAITTPLQTTWRKGIPTVNVTFNTHHIQALLLTAKQAPHNLNLFLGWGGRAICNGISKWWPTCLIALITLTFKYLNLQFWLNYHPKGFTSRKHFCWVLKDCSRQRLLLPSYFTLVLPTVAWRPFK